MADVQLSFGLGHLKHLSDETLEEYYERLDERWSLGLTESHEYYEEFRSRLGRDYGAGFDALHMVYSGVFEALTWADETLAKVFEDEEDDDREGFEAYYDVVRGLTARGLQAFNEVTWLLKGGFPNGAYVRSRTLHELYVTASILGQFGHPGAEHPELVERYFRHHEAFDRSTAENIMSTGMVDPTVFFDDATLAQLDRNREALLSRYGRSFGTMWGWAAPLFAKNERVTMDKLGDLVEPGLNFFYGMTSAHAHGGSQGWHENFVKRGDETVMSAGPTNLGLVVPAQLATTFLSGLVQISVPAIIETDKHPDDTGAMLLAGIGHLRERAMAGMEAGDEVVKEAERKYQDGYTAGDSEQR